MEQPQRAQELRAEALCCERFAFGWTDAGGCDAIGDPATLAGAGVLVTTWDYDGGCRRLQPDGSPHTFGGGDGTRDPLWMDSSGVIVLP